VSKRTPRPLRRPTEYAADTRLRWRRGRYTAAEIEQLVTDAVHQALRERGLLWKR